MIAGRLGRSATCRKPHHETGVIRHCRLDLLFHKAEPVPNGELQTILHVLTSAAGAGFEIRDVESLREHYAMTLRHWVKSLEEKSRDAMALVGNHTFRVWRLYMAASANAFAAAGINVIQTLLAKPDAQGHSNIPLTRDDLYAEA